MRASAILIAATAAVAHATKPDHDDGYHCAKPGASYCLGGDIILRCDDNGNGTPGKCSANLSGYPPFGGVASCWESHSDAGDAACEKNCVVHADPVFTIQPPYCTPTGGPNVTTTYTLPPPRVTQTTIPTTWYPNNTYTHPPGPPDGHTTYPHPPKPTDGDDCPGVEPTATMTTVYTHPGGPYPPPPPPAGGNGTSPGNGTAPGNSTTNPTTGGPGGPGGEHTPVPPTTTGAGTLPSGAAVANRAGNLLAVAGFVAAYFI